jgi:hypothetical protein
VLYFYFLKNFLFSEKSNFNFYFAFLSKLFLLKILILRKNRIFAKNSIFHKKFIFCKNSDGVAQGALAPPPPCYATGGNGPEVRKLSLEM